MFWAAINFGEWQILGSDKFWEVAISGERQILGSDTFWRAENFERKKLEKI